MDQTVYGPTITTNDMHNASVQGVFNPNEFRQFANSWFKYYELTVSVPAGWALVGSPWVHFVGPGPNVSWQDAQDGFNWNVFPAAHDRFFIIERNPNIIKCSCWAGSHAMQINLACNATHP
jgi:hypothetical protein